MDWVQDPGTVLGPISASLINLLNKHATWLHPVCSWPSHGLSCPALPACAPVHRTGTHRALTKECGNEWTEVQGSGQGLSEDSDQLFCTGSSPRRQTASQGCLPCLELCVTWRNSIAWGPQLWALPCPMLPVAVCELCTQTTPGWPFTGMTKHKKGNQFGPKWQSQIVFKEGGRGMRWHKNSPDLRQQPLLSPTSPIVAFFFGGHWVFTAACRLSLVAASRGYSSL